MPRREIQESCVGIVGFGAMGSAFAERLLAAGREVVVFDVDEERRVRARQAGAKVAGSPADVCRQCDVISVLVRTDGEVLSATTARGGVLEGTRPESVVLIHSTVLPDTTRAVERAAAAQEVHVLDACPTGTPREARAGKTTFLVGGEADLVSRVSSHLKRMGGGLIHLGPTGSGNIAKLVANLVIASERLVLEEALLLGNAAGIHFTTLLEALRATSADHVPVIEQWESVFDPESSIPTPKPGANLLTKDLPMASQYAKSLGLDLPIASAMERSALRFVSAA